MPTALDKAIATSAQSLKDLPQLALKEIQELLAKAGYQLEPDGLYGPKTAALFKNFKASVFQAKPDLIGKGSLVLLRKEAMARASGLTPSEAIAPVKSAPTIALPPKPTIKLTSKMLPTGGAVYVEKAVIPGGAFTWAELTKDGDRWPEDRYVEGNIVKLAQQLQHLKKHLGDRRMIITSAYRPYAVNRAIGGATASRHVHADAADFFCPELSTEELNARVAPYWGDRGGCAVSYGGGFQHIDLRGYKCVWVYG